MKKEHTYEATVTWTGNLGEGTLNYTSFERGHTISVANKPEILGSSDPAFRGDLTKYNPEELLIASLASCHMLWYLHLCSEANIVVTDYKDTVTGILKTNANGSGYFSSVTLNPEVTITAVSMKEKALELHNKANEMCFIANSVNFKVRHNPTCI